MKELWRVKEFSFIKTRNFTYDRFVFFSLKQQKIESVEIFYGTLIEQAENCILGDEETTLIRNTFFLYMLDYETQKKLLRQTVSATKSLEIDSRMEMRALNQSTVWKNSRNLDD